MASLLFQNSVVSTHAVCLAGCGIATVHVGRDASCRARPCRGTAVWPLDVRCLGGLLEISATFGSLSETIAIRLEAIALRLRAIAIRLQAIACRLSFFGYVSPDLGSKASNAVPLMPACSACPAAFSPLRDER